MQEPDTTPAPDTTTIPSAEAQREHAEALAAIVGSAGIDTPPAPTDFRTHPLAWIEEHIEPIDRFSAAAREPVNARAFAVLSALLEPYGSDAESTERDALPIARLLSEVYTRLEWQARDDSRWIRFGAFLLPTTPAALSVLRTLRKIAAERIHGGSLSIVDRESTLGILLSGIVGATKYETSPLLQGSRNATTSEPNTGFEVSLQFHARAMATLPLGKALPPALLSPDPVGFEVSDPMELAHECDMCTDGIVGFLENFGIDYTREGEHGSCGSCGAECEDSDSGDIETIDTFTLTEEMVAAIDRQGFADSLRAYISDGADSDTLAALLESFEDSEILARCAPDAEQGIRYDREAWRFDPDFESIEGAKEIAGGEALRAGALLSRIAEAHESAGALPPIGGVLHYRPLPYESARIGDGLKSTRPYGIRFVWDPEFGTLTHSIGGGLEIIYHVQGGGLRIEHHAPNQEHHGRSFPINAEGGSWRVKVSGSSAGADASTLLRIAKGRAEI